MRAANEHWWHHAVLNRDRTPPADADHDNANTSSCDWPRGRSAPLLTPDEEARLAHEIRSARVDMMHALAKVPDLVMPLLAAWEDTKTGDRAPSDVVQRPLAKLSRTAPSREEPVDSRALSVDSVVQIMRDAYASWLTGNHCAITREKMERLFVELAPAYGMLHELRGIAVELHERTPPRNWASLCYRVTLDNSVRAADAADARYRTARERMVEGNVGLVSSVALKFRNRGLATDDLVQEGYVGLLRAIDKFDERRRNRFSTYAVYWIRQAIMRALTDRRHTVRVPEHLNEQVSKLHALTNRLQQALMRAPKVSDIVLATGIPVSKVRELLAAGRTSYSLDREVDGEHGTTFTELLPAAHHLEPDEALADRQLRQVLEQHLGTLPEQEALVLRLRFGLGVTESRTLEKVGEHLGVSREWARLLERRAIEMLRRTIDATLPYYLDR